MAKITVEYLKHICPYFWAEKIDFEKFAELLNEKASEPEWISVKERLPSKEEQLKTFKFAVSNSEDNWTDAAYYSGKGVWDNGECRIYPTHWDFMPLPNKPN